MAVSKKGLFGKKETRLANLAKALSHPARIQILRSLVCKDMCNCCDMVEKLPLAQSTVSQHLKALKELGLIEMTQEGLKSNYRLNPTMIDDAVEILEEFLVSLKGLKCADSSQSKKKKN